MKPNILLLGQLTIDDTVPAEPGTWVRKLGGNALYSLAGAKLWCDPGELGVVTRVPCNLPFDVFAVLDRLGVSTRGLIVVPQEALIEWITYEDDGNRQSLPRNTQLRDPSADFTTLHKRYLEHIASISPSYQDIPLEWLPVEAIHLAPQVIERHASSCFALASRTTHLSIDPSPHYSRSMSASGLRKLLPGVTAFLPSQAEIEHMGKISSTWEAAVSKLNEAGFPEVLLKRGSLGSILITKEMSKSVALPPARAVPLDLTGAGDAFSGAYVACRAHGKTPMEAASCATVSAAMVIECFGAEEALQLKPVHAEARLNAYLELQEK